MKLKNWIAGTVVKFLKIGRIAVTDFEKKDGIAPPLETLQYEKVFGKNTWAYAGIYAIASSAAGLPLKVMRKLPDGELEEVKDHPFIKKIEEPNPFMTGYDLIELLFIFLESTGNAYWLFDNGEPNGLPAGSKLSIKQIKEIWPLPSHQVKVIPGEKDLVTRYEYKPMRGAKGMDLAVVEVFHPRYANPLSLYYGQGSIEPAKPALISDIYQERFNNNFFKNGALPPGFLKTEQALTKEQRMEFKESWAQMYQGVQNSHKLAVLEAGLDLVYPRHNLQEMQFMELANAARRKTLAALGVPPVFVGSEDAKYDNAEQQKQVFWENTMLPKLKKVANFLTLKMHQLGEPDELFVMFDTSKVKALQENYKTQADTAKVWWDMGVPVNPLIKIFGPAGMEAVEDGDTGFIPSLLVPTAEASSPAPLEPEGTPEDAPAPVGGKPSKKPKPGPSPAPASSGDSDIPVDTDKGLKAKDKKLDDYHWKKFIAMSEPGFRKLRVELKRLFASQRRRILSKVVQHYKKDISVDIYLLNVNEEVNAFSKATRKTIADIYDKAGAEAISDVGAGISFDVESVAAAQFLKERIFKFSFDVNETSRKRLQKVIGEAISEGKSQGDLVKDLQVEFDFWERYRSARIARTETGIAGNAGIMEGLRQAGSETKRWISSRDQKVRDTHSVADGQEVALEDPFDVGGYLLMQPGDPDGPPEEIINCRCTIRGLSSGDE